MAARTGWHRYGTKLRHCQPLTLAETGGHGPQHFAEGGHTLWGPTAKREKRQNLASPQFFGVDGTVTS